MPTGVCPGSMRPGKTLGRRVLCKVCRQVFKPHVMFVAGKHRDSKLVPLHRVKKDKGQAD